MLLVLMQCAPKQTQARSTSGASSELLLQSRAKLRGGGVAGIASAARACLVLHITCPVQSCIVRAALRTPAWPHLYCSALNGRLYSLFCWCEPIVLVDCGDCKSFNAASCRNGSCALACAKPVRHLAAEGRRRMRWL